VVGGEVCGEAVGEAGGVSSDTANLTELDVTGSISCSVCGVKVVVSATVKFGLSSELGVTIVTRRISD